MYLSRLILNPRDRRVRSEVASPYEMHRTLMRAFPENVQAQEERVLFRLDADRRSGGLTLLVQSLDEPNWRWLNEPEMRGYLLSVAEPNPQVKLFDPQFTVGQMLVFRLRANPTVKREGKRFGLVREEDQRAWLARKAEQSGFRVLSVRVSPEGWVRGMIHREEADHPLTLLSVRFDGLLQVSDPDKLSAALRRGIGSGKGFGFGLLSLAPMPK